MDKQKHEFYLPNEASKLFANYISDGDKLIFSVGFSERFVIYNQLQETDDWNDLFRKISSGNGNEKIVVFGRKSAGKSSLLRFMINSYKKMNCDSKLYYMDCDPGQTEFTPPGQISIVEIKDELYNLPCLNIFENKPLYSCSVGGIQTNNPNLYMTNVLSLIDFYQTELSNDKNMLFVNTMGWIRDLGLILLCDIIKSINPTHLIEIINENERETSQDDSFLQNIHQIESFLDQKPNHLLNYEFHKVNSSNKKRQLNKPKFNRTLIQLAYFSQIDGFDFKSINALTPFRMKWSAVFVHIANNFPILPQLAFDILNCSWIQMCKIQPEDNNDNFDTTNDLKVLKSLRKNKCFGCGILRNIDYINKCFYILTPEHQQVIDEVNCLVCPNGVNIPDELLLNCQVLIHDTKLPYVSTSFVNENPETL